MRRHDHPTAGRHSLHTIQLPRLAVTTAQTGEFTRLDIHSGYLSGRTDGQVRVCFAIVIRRIINFLAIFPFALGLSAEAATPSPEQIEAMRSAVVAYQNRKFDVALKLFHELAREGLPRAQTALGMMYAYGEGVPQDADEALHWYRTAAEQGYPPAEYNLGIMHLEGTLTLTRSKAKAAAWLKRAALNGHRSALQRLRTIDSWAYAEVLEARRAGANKAPQPRYRASTLSDLDLRLRALPETASPETTPAVAARPLTSPRIQKPLAKPSASIKRAAPKPPGKPTAAPKESAHTRTKSPRTDRDTASASPPRPATNPASRSFAVQILASNTAAAARAAWERYAALYPTLFKGLNPRITEFETNDGRGTLYRLRTSAMVSLAAARSFCARFTARDKGAGCLVVNAN